MTDLKAVETFISNCKSCELWSGRIVPVIDKGNPKADIMFIGEAPGEEESLRGFPFCGKSGKLLDKILSSIGLTRADIFIANTCACRPPKNRNPKPDEIKACNHILLEQINLIKPKVIVTLGTFSSQTILNTSTSISKLRGQFYNYNQTLVLPTFHPAYLLRNPAMKDECWKDMCLLRDKIKELNNE